MARLNVLFLHVNLLVACEATTNGVGWGQKEKQLYKHPSETATLLISWPRISNFQNVSWTKKSFEISLLCLKKKERIKMQWLYIPKSGKNARVKGHWIPPDHFMIAASTQVIICIGQLLLLLLQHLYWTIMLCKTQYQLWAFSKPHLVSPPRKRLGNARALIKSKPLSAVSAGQQKHKYSQTLISSNA